MQKCFKILTLSLICFSVICSTFAFTVSAAEYELGDPVDWKLPFEYNYYPVNRYETYFLEDNTGELVGYSTYPWSIWYYKNGYHTSGSFDTSFDFLIIHDTNKGHASYTNSSFKVRATDLDTSKNVLAFSAAGIVRNKLFLPTIAYEDIYIPSDNQVLKVEFSIDTLKLGTSYDIPSVFNHLLSPENLCWFELQDFPGSLTNYYSYVVPFSSVLVTPSKNGRVLHYTYYFNAYGEAFNDVKAISNGSLLKLCIRMPFYFGNSSQLIDGVFCLTNAVLPTSYEIITPGDYSQELDNINNAIIESNKNLMNYYDTISGADQAVIVHAQQQNDKLDSAIDDFNKSDDAIKDIVNSVVAPDIQGSASDAISYIDSSGIKNVFANPYIISLFTLVLGFGFLRLILYGTKEG